MAWQKATGRKKRHKLFIYGPTGSFKTRTALRLGAGPMDKEPILAVIDTEMGSDHYGDQFNFEFEESVEPDKIYKIIKDTVANPGKKKTLVIDTFTIYYQALADKYADLFLKREIGKVGHKFDYYTIQPADWQIINREARSMVRLLLKSDMNVIVVCQDKDEWEGLKSTGNTVPDGWKKLRFFFDTVFKIAPKGKGKGFAAYCEKDRTHHFKEFETVPWENDAQVVEYFTKQGYTFTDGPEAAGYVEPNAKPMPATPSSAPSSQPEPKAEGAPKGLADLSPQQTAEQPPKENKPQPQPAESEAPLTPSEPPAEKATKDQLLARIVELKTELRIVDANVWKRALAPYGVDTAMKMTDEQLQSFIAKLESLRPTKAAQAA